MKKLVLITLLLGVFSTDGLCRMVTFRSQTPERKYSATLEGYLGKPDGGGPFPAVILMHGCSGLAGSVLSGLREHAAYLGQNGFVTLILDSFGPRGKSGGGVCGSYAELAAARDYRTFDAYSALIFLKGKPFVDVGNIFLVGQSNGGSVALQAAGAVPEGFPKNTRFRAVAAYYPWCGALPEKLISPLLIFGAGRDDWVPPDRCRAWEKYVSGEEIRIVIYPDAHHSFDLPIAVQTYAGHTVGGNAEAAVDSREKMTAFFKKHALRRGPGGAD